MYTSSVTTCTHAECVHIVTLEVYMFTEQQPCIHSTSSVITACPLYFYCNDLLLVQQPPQYGIAVAETKVPFVENPELPNVLLNLHWVRTTTSDNNNSNSIIYSVAIVNARTHAQTPAYASTL